MENIEKINKLFETKILSNIELGFIIIFSQLGLDFTDRARRAIEEIVDPEFTEISLTKDNFIYSYVNRKDYYHKRILVEINIFNLNEDMLWSIYNESWTDNFTLPIKVSHYSKETKHGDDELYEIEYNNL